MGAGSGFRGGAFHRGGQRLTLAEASVNVFAIRHGETAWSLVDGDIALFAHGYVLRVLAAQWIGLPAGGGQHFLLDTGTLCVLGYYREIPAGRIWNGPLID
jgi:broad specificity phosphatase PhoE